MGMNKSKLMQYELDIILMDSFLLTAENSQKEFFIQSIWVLKIGRYMY